MYVYPLVLLLSKVLLKNQEGLCLRDPSSTGLASSALVLYSADPVRQTSLDTTSRTTPDLTRAWLPAASQPGGSSSRAMDTPWLTPQEADCSENMQNILLNSRKLSA
ncbi:coagulation factor VIII [Platysternon megacephalum]|uniref:Coagulation factor VIII n=1 Tax=Platysternon megacephalum TaxID=55544 RepID=A0A4D9DQ56_9SAUR|nr:coagulation factor VIII [Platysternon megacephalum]